MNYISFRIIIFVVLVLVTFIIFKYTKNNYIKKYFLIFEIVLFVFIQIYPIENNLFKFKTVDDAFNYYWFPSGTIKKKYEYDKYAYIVYDDYKTDVPGLMYFTKKDGSYHINNLITRGIGKNKMYGDFNLFFIKIPKINSTGIIMYYREINKKDGGKIADSLSSEFVTYKGVDTDLDTKIVIINDKIDSNYTIYFNGKEYKPFK